jgi:predicted ATP-grasp superfamily ATP-dependent carboligase
VEAPEVADLSRRLLRAFDYRGFVCTEFKRDAASGIYSLIEINPRAGAGNQMAITAGVDIPWIGYRHLTGSDGDAGKGAVFRPGVEFVNEELDGVTIGRWARSTRGTRATAVWARDDPLPFVVLVWRLARRRVRSALMGRSRAARGFRRLVRIGGRRL